MNFQLDIGATCNILSQSDLAPQVAVLPTQQSLTLFDESQIKPLGKCMVQLINPKNGARYRGDFVVVDKSLVSLLGAPWHSTNGSDDSGAGERLANISEG